MKKLLLLLLVPTFIQAEEFNLVCEGERLSFDNFDNESKYSKTITVKVKEESITIDKVNYSDAKFDDSLEKNVTNYLKNNDSIKVFRNITDNTTKERCNYLSYTADIDRVSGVIKTELRITDKCMDRRDFTHIIFEGKCKKQKGNAF